jgi:ABC-type amino acid transport substrate-binding protein
VTLVRAYENQPEFRWEIAVGMRKSDDALVAAINEAIDRLLADGTVNRIYISYGVEPSSPRGQ